MAPGIEIPVVAVVDEALRGNFTGAGLVALAVVVVDAQSVTLQDGMGNGLEVPRVFAPRGDAQKPDALGDFARAEVLACKKSVDAGFQRPQVVVEQSRFQIGEQVFQGDEGMQFGGGEPPAR